MEPEAPAERLPTAAPAAEPTTPQAADADLAVHTTEPPHAPEAAAPPAAEAQHNALHDTMAALRLGSMRIAAAIRSTAGKVRGGGEGSDAAPAASAAADAAAEEAVPAGDGSTAAAPPAAASGGGEAETLKKLKSTAAELGAKAKEQGSRFYAVSVKTAVATAEGLRRLAVGEPVQALCRAETASRPVPQLVLACCTAIVAGEGLRTALIFRHEPPQEMVDRLAAVYASDAVGIIPPATSPHACAALLKRFLAGLPEPLLTYRLLPQWVAAADSPATEALDLLAALPAANLNILRLLMQTGHYVELQAATNEMDAQALAEALAPCLAWKPPPRPAAGGGSLQRMFSTKAAPSAAPGPAEGRDEPAAAAVVAGEGATDSAADAGAAPAAPAAAGEDPAGAAASGSLPYASRIVPLEGAELEAIVAVLQWLISHYPAASAAVAPSVE